MKQENTVSNSDKGSFKSKDYSFSRVYLLQFSKGQLGPLDTKLNNKDISRKLYFCIRNNWSRPVFLSQNVQFGAFILNIIFFAVNSKGYKSYIKLIFIHFHRKVI